MQTAYNDANFRAQFPAFANTTTYPEVVLQAYWTMGSAYVSPNNAGCLGWMNQAESFTQQQAQLASDLMAAHLAVTYTQLQNQAGQKTGGSSPPGVPGIITSATQGSVSVSFAAPPTATGLSYFLATTPYGQQLRALLRAVGGIGAYIGGSSERSGFRKIGGRF